jgi:predicted dehydrogenase
VVVAVPTPAHAAVSVAALDGGLHVLQEKPLTRTSEEAELIRAAIKRSGTVFQVGYEVRSSALHQTVMRHVQRGDLGELTNIWYNQHTYEKRRAEEWRNARSNMGGKLFDCAVHYFDIMQQWAGAPVVRIAAFGNALKTTGPQAEGLPESAVVCLEYANGVRGTYNFCETTKVNDDSSFGLAGTTGRIAGNPWLPEGAGSFELRTDRGVMKAQCVFDAKLTSPGHLGFTEEMERFARTVLDGAPNVCCFEDALALHRQMMAIDQALATGEVVTL